MILYHNSHIVIIVSSCYYCVVEDGYTHLLLFTKHLSLPFYKSIKFICSSSYKIILHLTNYNSFTMTFHFRRLCCFPALLAVVLQLLHGVAGQLVVVDEPITAPPPPLVDLDGGDVGIVPAMFVFGDSLIDNGNNNNIPSFAKANYFPYGIDFNGGPTGRFCNGLTMVDGIGMFLVHVYIYNKYLLFLILFSFVLYQSMYSFS